MVTRENRILRALHNVRLSRQGKYRAILMFFGSILLVVTLVVRWLSAGFSGNLGPRQIMLILVSLILILAGWLGKRLFVYYRGVSILLMNTILLFTFAEIGANAISRGKFFPSYFQTVLDSYQRLPYYVSQNWSENFFQEADYVENYQYHPYSLWRHKPFDGESMNVNLDSIRETPGAICTPGAYKIFAFGGSSMWGWGAPDWGTIPAYIQAVFEHLMDEPVCVVNFGEDGYVSTQSLIELIRQIHHGNVPDAVIFYDGFNDVFAAYESGLPGLHTSLESIRARFEPREHPMLDWAKSSRVYWLAVQLISPASRFRMENLRSRRIDWENPSEVEHLAESVVEVYLSNYRVVDALSEEYGFDSYFFWQPHLALDGKRLTQEELSIKATLDPKLSTLAELVYVRTNASVNQHPRLWDISDALENHDAQLWIDIWGHVTPEGNRIIADRMMEIIVEDLKQD